MGFTTDFASFRSSVGSWLDVTDLSTTLLDDAITVGEKRIQRGDGTPNEPGLRVKEMETAFTWTITGSGTVAVPSDFLEMKTIRLDESPAVKLVRKSVEFIYDCYPYRDSNERKPKYFAREGSNFIFGPSPDSQYVVKGVYYKTLTGMVAAATTNGVFTAYPDLFLKAAIIEGEKLLGRDARIPIWEPDFKKGLQSANRQAEIEEYGGSTLSVTYSGAP
jgi:hypothetical protein